MGWYMERPMFERGSKYHSMPGGYEQYCEDLERWKSHCSQMRTERWIKDHSYPEVHSGQSSRRVSKKSAKGGYWYRVPYGVYRVTVNKLELRRSKKGNPMITCQAKILEGKYKGCSIFTNQVIMQESQICAMDGFLGSLISGTANPVNVQFKSYAQYADVVAKVLRAIDGCEYSVRYSEEKGFGVLEVKEVYT